MTKVVATKLKVNYSAIDKKFTKVALYIAFVLVSGAQGIHQWKVYWRWR